jgi:tetratricopeptide (TPR) repeat protein
MKKRRNNLKSKTAYESHLRVTHPMPIVENSKNWKKVFYSTVVLLSITMLIAGWGTGFHSDEMDQNAYGKTVIKYYNSFGKDTSFLHPHLPNGVEVAPAIKTYGVLFDVFLNNVTSVFNLKYEYDVRHSLIQLSALLCLFFASLISVQLTKSYLIATITFVLIYFTPTFFGHSLMNCRDIPFALGYTACLYFMIEFITHLKHLTFKRSIFFALALGFAMSVRIGGLMLYVIMLVALLFMIIKDRAYLLDAFKSNQLLKWVAHLLILGVVPMVILALSHPYILLSPIENFLTCVNTAVKFPNKIPLNYDGKLMDSFTIPKTYLINWFSITIPVVVILMFVLGLFSVFWFKHSKKNQTFYLILIFAIVFPVGYSILKSSALYTGWRHFLFVYPTAVVIATWWISKIPLKNIKQQYLCLGIVFVFLLHPIQWMIKNHPFEYIYFNELSGGFDEKYYEYETDGWQLSAKKALEWLETQDHFKNRKNKFIASNSPSAIWYLLKEKYKDTNTQVAVSSFKSINMVDWDYMILNVNFLEPKILKEYFPPYRCIKTIDVDNRPVCAILYDTIRQDYHAYEAFEKDEYQKADSLLRIYRKEEPKAEKILLLSSLTKYQLGQYDSSIQYANQYLDIYPPNGNLLYGMAMCYYQKANYKKALELLEFSIDFGHPMDRKVLLQFIELSKFTNSKERYEFYLKRLKEMK